MKTLRHWPWAFGGIAVGLAVLAILVRLTVRDRIEFFAPLFYATPPAIIGAAFALAGGMSLTLRRRKVAVGAFAASVACIAWQVLAHWHAAPAPIDGGEPVRVMVWNVARGARGWTRVAEQVSLEAPDLVCLVEGGSDSPDQAQAWAWALPDHDRRRLEGGMILAARGRILEVVKVDLDGGGRAARARVEVRGRALTVVLVDMWADPFRSRGPAFEALGRVLKPLQAEALIVLGDFNTPLDSVYFDPMRDGFVHAFEAAGRGFSGTWPMPVPILPIDHLWVRRAPVRSCRLGGSGASDHRWIVAELY